jgi:hypothetical protein
MKKSCFFIVVFFAFGYTLYSQVIPGSIVDEPVNPYLATPVAGHVKTVPVVILRYLPTTDGMNLDVAKATDYWDLGYITLTQLKANIDKYLAGLKFSLEEGSKFHGYKDPSAVPYLGYKVLKFWTIYDQIPISSTFQLGTAGGYPVYEPDFIHVYNDFGLQQYIEANGVEEIWIWFGQCAMPGWPSYNPAIHLPQNYVEFVESNMASPVTGDISNSHRFPNDIPIASKTAVVYCYNFRRSQAEAVHNHGHQLESIYKYTAEQQDGNYNLFVHDFSGWGENYSTPPLGRAGDCHHPPNTTADYDYLNTTLVQSDIEDWKPAVGQKKWVNVNTWGNLSYAWPAGYNFPQLTESQWYIYWMQNMPGYCSAIPYNSNYMTNWWQFTSDWDSCNINDVGLYAAVLSNLQVSNTTIAAGTDKCFNAAQTITVAGDGTTVKVEGGGTATFISGQKVLLKPVTKVLSGGYLHAYITTTSAYCGSAFKPLVENPENSADDPQPADQNLKINRIRIYPNPASDFIMIEFDQTKTPAEVFVSIYNMSGKPVHQQWMRGEGIRQLPLTGVPAGIYLVQVQSEGQPEIVKVMKY